jgi:hypothetical protein
MNPKTTPQKKASAMEDLKEYLTKNFGERDGARRYVELTAGIKDSAPHPEPEDDPAAAAEAARQSHVRYLENAWKMSPLPYTEAALQAGVKEGIENAWRWRLSHL